MELIKKAKLNYTYEFYVPCHYRYEIKAESEEQARRILCEKGGLDIDGELLLEPNNFKNAICVGDKLYKFNTG